MASWNSPVGNTECTAVEDASLSTVLQTVSAVGCWLHGLLNAGALCLLYLRPGSCAVRAYSVSLEWPLPMRIVQVEHRFSLTGEATEFLASPHMK
eukprot:scaffold125655_cov33-Tisochrysis_lutea.AAC.1